jgi:hypothetical protein
MTLSRRQLLRGLGGVAVSLPIMSSLLPRRARGQTAPPPVKRFVVFFHPNGVIPNAWWPTAGASESEFVLGRCHSAALERHRSKLIYLRGIDMLTGKAGPGERHQTGMGTLLTGLPLLEGNFVGGDGSLAGWGSGLSVDQRIAQTIGIGTALPSLQLGVRASGAEVRHRLSYLGSAQPLPPLNDPRQVFDLLFSDSQTNPDEMVRIRRQKKSVLDAVMAQFSAVNRRASSADRHKLESHLDLVRDIERRIEIIPPGSGECLAPSRPPVLEVDSERTMPEIARLQIDLLAVALACDLTRVASVQFSNAENHIRFPWINSLGDGHALSHAGPSSTLEAEQLIQRDTWYAEQYAHLLDRLSVTEDESTETVLDRSVVFYCNELSVGNMHSHVEMPFILAGSAGGYFRTGRLLQYDHTSHCNLLVSFLNAMGIEETVFGMPQHCTGPLAGLI